MKQLLCAGLILSQVSLIALAGEFKVYFGNLHSHTSYSDGSGISGVFKCLAGVRRWSCDLSVMGAILQNKAELLEQMPHK